MCSIDELKDLSREGLYVLINKLNKRINCMETDILRYKSYFKQFHRYFDQIEENSETTEGLNDLIKDIKTNLKVNDSNLFVEVKKLEDDFINFNFDEYLISKDLKIVSENQELSESNAEVIGLDSNQLTESIEPKDNETEKSTEISQELTQSLVESGHEKSMNNSQKNLSFNSNVSKVGDGSDPQRLPFRCNSVGCDREFANRDALKLHIRKCQKRRPKHYCTIGQCQYKSDRPSRLKKHQQTHRKSNSQTVKNDQDSKIRQIQQKYQNFKTKPKSSPQNHLKKGQNVMTNSNKINVKANDE